MITKEAKINDFALEWQGKWVNERTPLFHFVDFVFVNIDRQKFPLSDGDSAGVLCCEN